MRAKVLSYFRRRVLDSVKECFVSVLSEIRDAILNDARITAMGRVGQLFEEGEVLCWKWWLQPVP